MSGVVAALSRDEALSLTEDIRNHAAAVWSLLIRAHNGKAWKALGYATWAEYVGAEFNMSRGRSYQILDQARVIQEIEAAVSTNVDISEWEARDLKRDLPTVVAAAKQAVADLPEDAPEPERREAVKAAIQQARPVVSIKTKETVETTETYDAQTGEIVEPAEDVLLAAAESSQRLQDGRYVAAFLGSLGRLSDVWAFDAERLGQIADRDVIESAARSAESLGKWVRKLERAASGLRAIKGGK